MLLQLYTRVVVEWKLIHVCSSELGDSFAFVIKAFWYIALCKLFCWLEIKVFIFMKKRCVFCRTYNPILLIKQRTNILLDFLVRNRGKDINYHCHMNLWCSVDYELLRYTSVQNFCGGLLWRTELYRFVPGYQETATVKSELDLCTSAAKIR